MSNALTASGAGGRSTTITGIVAGTSCTVAETGTPSAGANASWGSPTYNPANGAVTIVVNQTVTVTVANPRTVTPPTPTPTLPITGTATPTGVEVAASPTLPSTSAAGGSTGSTGGSLALILALLAIGSIGIVVLSPLPRRTRR